MNNALSFFADIPPELMGRGKINKKLFLFTGEEKSGKEAAKRAQKADKVTRRQQMLAGEVEKQRQKLELILRGVEGNGRIINGNEDDHEEDQEIFHDN